MMSLSDDKFQFFTCCIILVDFFKVLFFSHLFSFFSLLLTWKDCCSFLTHFIITIISISGFLSVTGVVVVFFLFINLHHRNFIILIILTIFIAAVLASRFWISTRRSLR